VFVASKIGTIAGSMVTSGVVRRNAKFRLLRDNIVVYTGDIESLAREGRRARGQGRLRVRYQAQELQRHQGRRPARGLRDQGSGTHL
jgi:hypothetical protein